MCCGRKHIKTFASLSALNNLRDRSEGLDLMLLSYRYLVKYEILL